MNLRLKTNLDVETKLSELQGILQLSSKAAVMRIAIGYSVKLKSDPRIIDGELYKYNIKEQNGSDYLRHTVFSDDELFYKLMMEQSLNKYITDDEFFPELTFYHVYRGIKALYSDVKLYGSKEKWLKHILNENKIDG